jgi:prepilin-type N-terminal cleavage/methylation domain-containing protein/prepilin-type processing-associated H-X9-DG protein
LKNLADTSRVSGRIGGFFGAVPDRHQAMTWNVAAAALTNLVGRFILPGQMPGTRACEGITAGFGVCRGRPAQAGVGSGFTLIELLVVIAIIALLAAMVMPGLARAKALAYEKGCASNLRQVNLILWMYAEDHAEYYPLELTEHNPHPELVARLEAYQPGLISALYCPQAPFSERYARDPAYTPKGATDSVIDTPTNRVTGNISYIYWSFQTNKFSPEAGGYWREITGFIPRQIKSTGVVWLSEMPPPPEVGPAERWVMSDFFRQGAPFPHGRRHARGLNLVYLDGHAGLMRGRPRANYR